MTLLYSTPSPSVIPWTPLWPPLGPFVPSPSRRSLEHPDHFDQALHDDHLHLTVSQGLSARASAEKKPMEAQLAPVAGDLPNVSDLETTISRYCSLMI